MHALAQMIGHLEKLTIGLVIPQLRRTAVADTELIREDFLNPIKLHLESDRRSPMQITCGNFSVIFHLRDGPLPISAHYQPPCAVVNAAKAPFADSIIFIRLSKPAHQNFRFSAASNAKDAQIDSCQSEYPNLLAILLQSKLHISAAAQSSLPDNPLEEYRKIGPLSKIVPFVLLVLSDAQHASNSQSLPPNLLFIGGDAEMRQLHGDFLQDWRSECLHSPTRDQAKTLAKREQKRNKK